MTAYEPGKSDIYTYLDCDAFMGTWTNVEWCSILLIAGIDEEYRPCERARRLGYCPRGYAP